MKNTIFKSNLISVSVAVAIGFSVAQLNAYEGQAASQVGEPDPRQVTQPVDQNPLPSDGEGLIDEVNRGTVTSESRRASHDPIDADDFVEEASARGHAEIGTARLALEQGSPSLRVYASKVIEDHTATNNELKAVAVRAGLDVSDDVAMMDKARAWVLSVREGESFDQAFVENQITAHEYSIELYERAAMSDHPEVSAFARGKLPALREHLHMATALKNQIESR
jgi:putative membrane protein